MVTAVIWKDSNVGDDTITTSTDGCVRDQIRNILNVSPGGMYWQDPEELTSTFVWKVASNLSSALQGRELCLDTT